ncbi:MAG: insulinase family protein [Polyangiaceae bacterium]|nr:insulinase family protein [Polyangiaceae bacterium]
MRLPALLVSGALFAVTGLSQATPPPKPPAALSLPVEQYQLDNGLTVLLSEDHRLPVVAAEVRYLVGSAHEKKGKSGFAHLFEHLMFQGSKHFDDEYFKPFEPIGGSVNGTTTQDRTNFFERVPSNYLDVALWMESDRMHHLLPALSQDKLDNQRDVVKNERRQRYENPPYGMAWIYLTETLYPASHPYGHSVIGSHADLSAASLDDVKGFFREYYGPANAVVTVVGDFRPDQAKALVKKYFGGAEGSAGKRAALPTASMPKIESIVHVTKTDDVKLPRIYLAWHTPAIFAPGDAELDLFSSILTSGKTSRLYKPLVYDKKVAKDVEAFQASMQLSSFYVVQVTAAPGKTLKELESALLDALKTALATPPSDDEMKRAVNGYKKDFYERVEGAVSRASTLSTYYHATGKGDFLKQDLARYTGATPQSVHATATKWLDLGRYVRIDIVQGAKAGGAQQ